MPLRLAPTARRTAALLALAASALPALAADGWQWLPALNDPAWRADASLAVTGQRVMPGSGPDANAWGLEFAMQCGLLQSPDRRIRTHLNLGRSSENGTTVRAFELSPRYTVPLADGLSLGAGPSLGLFRVSQGGTSRTLPGLGAAAGVGYRVGMFHAGFDLRVHATPRRGGLDHDPVTLGAKVGVQF
ncbi:MAG: hypothetical protein RL456_2631 [Pseudomonadota bacterium]|jgi:hypothetical protein